MTDPETPNMVLAGIAAGGGAARRLNTIISKDAPMPSWGVFLGELVMRMTVSVFVGFVCLWIMYGITADPPENARYLAVALGGWSGGEIMTLVTKIWKRRVLGDSEPPNKP